MKLKIGNGNLELLKYVAFFMMVAFHFEKYVCKINSGLIFYIGSMAMPLFSIVVAYNYAVICDCKKGRMLKRLLVLAVVSQIPYYYMTKNLFDLNIVFTLFVALCIIKVLEDGLLSDIVIMGFLAAFLGLFVNGQWYFLFFIISIYYLFKKETFWSFFAVSVAVSIMCFLNDNYSFIIILFIVLFCSDILKNIKIKRIKYLFYYLYPLHLIVIDFIIYLKKTIIIK